jgi:hypothetical protein
MSRTLVVSLWALLAFTPGVTGCGAADIGPGLGGSGPSATPGTGSEGPGGPASGSGGSAGGASAGEPNGPDAASPIMLACPSGFTVCNGVCLEGALVGPIADRAPARLLLRERRLRAVRRA